MDKEKILKAGEALLQGYTQKELEAFEMGALYGARNHKELNKHPRNVTS